MSKKKEPENRYETRTVVVVEKGAFADHAIARLESYGVVVIEKKPKASFEVHYLDLLKEVNGDELDIHLYDGEKE